jgi:hypothetical protein
MVLRGKPMIDQRRFLTSGATLKHALLQLLEFLSFDSRLSTITLP